MKVNMGITIKQNVFTFECPYDGTPVQFNVEPDSINLCMEVLTPSVVCDTCHTDITTEIHNAVNAPLLLAHECCRQTGMTPTAESLYQIFMERYGFLRRLIHSAEYLTPRNRSILMARYGFDNGICKSFRQLAEEHGLSTPQGAREAVISAMEAIMRHNGLDIIGFLNPMEEQARSPEPETEPVAREGSSILHMDIPVEEKARLIQMGFTTMDDYKSLHEQEEMSPV
jgi:hypothetical protein